MDVRSTRDVYGVYAGIGLEVLGQLLLSSSRDNRNRARVGLEELQGIANRLFEIVINNKTHTVIEKFALIAECRDVAEGEMKEQLFFREGIGQWRRW